MDEHIQEVIQLFDGTRATFLESIKSVVDEMQNSTTDWETFETNVCYATLGHDVEISFVEKCIGRKLTIMEKHILLELINAKN